MKKGIVVPLDGSRFGEHALPFALELSRKTGAPIHLVHVRMSRTPIYPAEVAGIGAGVPADEPAWEGEYLEAVAGKLATRTKSAIKTVLLEGPAAETIAEYCEGNEARLAILTTHGRGMASRFWLGSTTDKLLRRSPTPLFLVHGKDDPNLDHPVCFKRCLVPLDGSEFSEQILAPLQELGATLGTEFTLAHVVEDPVAVGYPPVIPVEDLGIEGRERLRAEARAYLDRVADRLTKGAVRPQTRVVESFHAAAGVLDLVQPSSADWIALSTHGRKGISRLLLGSVADKVIRGSPRPVFVFRPVHT